MDVRFESLTGEPVHGLRAARRGAGPERATTTPAAAPGAVCVADDGVLSSAVLAVRRLHARPPAATSTAATAGPTCSDDFTHGLVLHARASAATSCSSAQTGSPAWPAASACTLALGFGRAREARRSATARASLARGFAAARAEYSAGWRAYFALAASRCPASAAGWRASYDASAMVLAAHEDKTFRGGFVAAPGRPWAWANELQHLPVYIAVWSRDLYEIATGLLAAGDEAAANRALDYLWSVQQRPDGSFPQNSRLDGEPVFGGLQMDEVAFPIVLAWQLGRTGAARLGQRAPARPTSSSPRGRAPTRSAGRTSAASRRRRSPPRSPGWSARPTSPARTATPALADRYLAVADEWQAQPRALDADHATGRCRRSPTTCGSPTTATPTPAPRSRSPTAARWSTSATSSTRASSRWSGWASSRPTTRTSPRPSRVIDRELSYDDGQRPVLAPLQLRRLRRAARRQPVGARRPRLGRDDRPRLAAAHRRARRVRAGRRPAGPAATWTRWPAWPRTPAAR